MMKVIFLDIDGVLNSHSFLMTNKSALFDPDKIKILNPEGAEAVKSMAKYWSGDFTDPTPGKKLIHNFSSSFFM